MIPNIIHFIQLGPRSLNLIHYIAIESAILANRPDAVYFHYDIEPEGELWNKLRPKLHLNKVVPPDSIHGNKLYHLAHKADILRLDFLYQIGGIYLDLDTISVKNLNDFRNHEFVIGREASMPIGYTFKQKLSQAIKYKTYLPFKPFTNGLCNAVMLSKPNAKFIELWLETYKTFRSKGKDEFWNEHSVLMPLKLAKENPNLIYMANYDHFHFPLFDDNGLDLLFTKRHRFKNAYVHHLWETASKDRYLDKLTKDIIMTEDTTYNLLARRVLD